MGELEWTMSISNVILSKKGLIFMGEHGYEWTMTFSNVKFSKKTLSRILGLEKYEVTAWLHPRKKNRGLKRRKRKHRKETKE